MTLDARRITALLGVAGVAWLGGAVTQREPARAAAPAAAPALRHQFMNNLDVRRQRPDARGRITVRFPTPLPGSPTILLNCANPRYAVKVHDATANGFSFAVYRTQDALQTTAKNPFEGDEAIKPVTDYRDTDNVDVAWVAIAN